MHLNRTVLFVSLLALIHISPFMVESYADEDPLARATQPDSEDDLLQLLDDQPEESAANLWESLLLGEHQSHFRARLSDVTEQDYAAHLLRAYTAFDHYSVSALIQRDVAEPNMIDLWRVAIETDISGANVILGDFRVDQQSSRHHYSSFYNLHNRK